MLETRAETTLIKRCMLNAEAHIPLFERRTSTLPSAQWSAASGSNANLLPKMASEQRLPANNSFKPRPLHGSA